MNKLGRAEKRANRRAAEILERQQKLDRREREWKNAKEQKEILAENRRTVRDNYDNATALYKRKKKLRRTLIYTMLGLFLCSIGMIALSFLLFQVKKVEVTGCERYAEQDLKSSIGLEGGENIFLVDTNGIVDQLCYTYPYIESVDVKRVWPDTIRFVVTEASHAYAVLVEGSEDTYALLSASEKILECTEILPNEQVCLVQGVSVQSPQPGKPAAYSDETGASLLHDLLQSLAENEIETLNLIDVTDSSDLIVEYENRLKIQIGTAASLDYKLQFAKKLIDEEIDSKQSGTIDVRNASLRRASFQPNASTSAASSVEAETSSVESSQGPMTDEGDYDREAEKPYRGF